MDICSHIDHTLLKPFATKQDLARVCAEAREMGFASVCVNPCNVAFVAAQLRGSAVKTCSVVGFPFGTHTLAAKLTETAGALADGAEEIDMVINVGRLLEGNEAAVRAEVQALADLCHASNAILKVIIETCYLNETQIAAMCRIVSETGADFIKTSTGYGTRGASADDIRLFKKYLTGPVKIKASGGIRSAADAQMYLSLGCERLGTSSGVAIARELAAQA